MINLITLIVLTFTTYASAISTDLKNVAAANIELVPPCICGNSAGLFCGERASAKDPQKAISGTCNATSLYYCSPWAVKTGGVASPVQAPCWTGICHQATQLGVDSCHQTSLTLPDQCICGTADGYYCGERAFSQSPAKDLFGNCSDGSLYFCHKSKRGIHSEKIPCLTNICIQKPYRTKDMIGQDSCGAMKRDLLDLKVGPEPPAHCTCHGSTGFFCGERASSKYSPNTIKGNCSASSLYYCSSWAVETQGIADTVQTPCWTGKCYQYKRAGTDSCTAIKSRGEELALEAATVPSAPCICGSSIGNFCGERATAKDPNTAISGDCDAASLYYCSPWAVKTNGLADNVQTPCWTHKCHQSTMLGYDSCTTTRSDAEESKLSRENYQSIKMVEDHYVPTKIAARVEVVPEAAANPLPACTCGQDSCHH